MAYNSVTDNVVYSSAKGTHANPVSDPTYETAAENLYDVYLPVNNDYEMIWCIQKNEKIFSYLQYGLSKAVCICKHIYIRYGHWGFIMIM